MDRRGVGAIPPWSPRCAWSPPARAGIGRGGNPFNNVSGAITIAGGASAGKCTIDFRFKIDDRFFTATGLSTGARGVSCYWGSTANKLDCFRWNDAGAGASGPIMVVIY